MSILDETRGVSGWKRVQGRILEATLGFVAHFARASRIVACIGCHIHIQRVALDAPIGIYLAETRLWFASLKLVGTDATEDSDTMGVNVELSVVI